MLSAHVSVPTCIAVLSVFAWAGGAARALADGATRDLPDQYMPNVSVTVSISIVPPPDPVAAIVEDVPPRGWLVSSISNGGSWDVEAEKVKWGPFFDPSIPASVSYDVTPRSAGGGACFAGTVFFATEGLDIDGDQCIATAVPTLSEWGVLVMAATLATCGIIVLRRRQSAIHTR